MNFLHLTQNRNPVHVSPKQPLQILEIRHDTKQERGSGSEVRGIKRSAVKHYVTAAVLLEEPVEVTRVLKGHDIIVLGVVHLQLGVRIRRPAVRNVEPAGIRQYRLYFCRCTVAINRLDILLNTVLGDELACFCHVEFLGHKPHLLVIR